MKVSLWIFLVLVFITFKTEAIEMTRKDTLDFEIPLKEITKDEILYSMDVINNDHIKRFETLNQLDIKSISKTKDSKLFIFKSAYLLPVLVKKDKWKSIVSLQYLKQTLNDHEIKMLTDGNFQLEKKGWFGYRYQLETQLLDSNFLNNSSEITEAVKKGVYPGLKDDLAFVVVNYVSNFNKYSIHGLAIGYYYKLGPQKMLVVNYGINAVQKFYAIEWIIHQNFASDLKEQVPRTRSWFSASEFN